MPKTKDKLCTLASCHVSAGFPSPATDYMEEELDLNKLLIRNPDATFFVKVSGESMVDVGIQDGDILVIDRSLVAKSGSIILAVVEDEFTIKRLLLQNNRTYLVPENKNYQTLDVTNDESFRIWGVVSSSIHKFQ